MFEPIVEVRDKLLQRHGQLDGYTLSFSDVFNGVGIWKLTVPAENQLLEILRAKGSGIIFTYGNIRLSGRMTKAFKTQSSNADETPLGIWHIEGVFDNEELRARNILPDWTLEPDSQTTAYYVDSGNFETVAKKLVKRNAGIDALPRRQGLLTAPDLERGNPVGVRARFKNLLAELQERAISGGLGFNVAQEATSLVFDVYQPRDMSKQVRMTVENGELSSSQWGYSAPSSTEVWVLGQGEGADRTVEVVTTSEAEDEADEWGLRYEVVKDQRNTDEVTELQQAGLELLAETGSTIQTVTATPAEAPNMRVGIDWWLGDLVTVTVDGQDIAAVVAQVSVIVDSRGVVAQAKIGDPAGFSFEYKQAARLKSVESRVSALEANAEASAAPDLSHLALRDLSNLTSSNVQIAGGSVGINKSPTQGDLDVNGLIYQQGYPVLDSRDSTYLPTDYAKYTPSADYSTYPLGTSVTLVEPNAGWAVSGLYGTLVTHRSYYAGGGTIQYWSSYQSGNSAIYYRQWYYNASSWSAWVNLSDASSITSGTFTLARIPTLDAGRIPSLDAGKITTGTFADARIPNLNASKITAGTFADARIPNLNASKITAGTFAAARLPAATESAIGAVERATTAEVQAGTDTTRYVSPAGVKNAFAWVAGNRGTAQSIPAGAFTTIIWGSGEIAAGGGATISGNSFVLPRAGRYEVSALVTMNGNGAKALKLTRQSGGTMTDIANHQNAHGVHSVSLSGSILISASTQIVLQAYSSVATTTTSSGGYTTSIAIREL